MVSLNDIQELTTAWRNRNFPAPEGDIGRAALEQLAGVTEEAGELAESLMLTTTVGRLAHAVLKADQGIRNNEELDAQGQDAVGDLIIYLCGLCTRKGWDLRTCVDEAWKEVSERDWIKYPDTGRPPTGDGVGPAQPPTDPLPPIVPGARWE